MNIPSFLLGCSLVACSASVSAQTQTQTQTQAVTVRVEKIEGYGESGDAFTFETVSGKRYMVYNAGGSSPIQGEALIQQSAKHKQKICLLLDPSLHEPRMVQAVKKVRVYNSPCHVSTPDPLPCWE